MTYECNVYNYNYNSISTLTLPKQYVMYCTIEASILTELFWTMADQVYSMEVEWSGNDSGREDQE